MDSQIAQYRLIVEQVLQVFLDFLGQDKVVQTELVFDRDRDPYLLIEFGWQNNNFLI